MERSEGENKIYLRHTQPSLVWGEVFEHRQ